MTDSDNASFEDRKQAVGEADTKARGKWQMWKAALDARLKTEKDWRKEGERIEEIYEAEPEKDAAGLIPTDEFNILYSNTETLLPALYNSTPIPDIRRRYNDPGKAAKAVADILDRAIQYQMDCYGFDAEVQRLVYDLALPGRGCGRVRYEPVVEDGAVRSQHVRLEWVPWKNLIIGPGDTWRDIDWLAFQHFLTKDELRRLLKQTKSKVSIDEIKLDQDTDEKAEESGDSEPPEGDVFKRATVYEIWDKVEQQVIFIADSYTDGPLAELPDTLKLSGFWPVPQPVSTGDVMEPVPFYRAYATLAQELNEVTRRIAKLVEQCRYRGIYLSSNADAANLFQADDGEFIPVQGLEQWIDNGGIEKAVLFFPLDPLVKALQQLYQSREQIKQTIYEVSGLSDILRGASQASETATAQNIKNQWGSLRIQRAQAEVVRYIRDVFRIKCEIIANHFDLDMLVAMTGVQLIKQADLQVAQLQAQQLQQSGQPVPEQLQDTLDMPVYEEVEQMLRDDVLRQYKIDVETDSTIRADLTRNQQTIGEFIQGTAAYIQAVTPAVQTGMMPPETAVSIYAAFARQFRLGRQVDMELEKLVDQAQQKANQPPPPPPPDPNMEKVKGQLALEGQKLDLEKQKTGAQIALEKYKTESQMKLEGFKVQAKEDRENRKQHAELQMRQHEHAMTIRALNEGRLMDASRFGMEQQAAADEQNMNAQRHGMEMRNAQVGMRHSQEAHQAALAAQKQKAQQAKQKQNGKSR